MKPSLVVPLLALALAGCAAEGEPEARSTTTASVASNTVITPEATTEEPEPTLSTSDFEITVKITRKKCFGSSGCNVDAKLVLAASDYAQAVAADITVSITGDESGPSIETITTDGEGGYDTVEVSLSTPSKSTKIKAKITEIEVTG